MKACLGALCITLLLATAGGLSFATPAPALTGLGGGLHFQSPQPFGWSIGEVAFKDADNLWATVLNNHTANLAHSSDKGTTWRFVDLGLTPGTSIVGLTFTDPKHARAIARWVDGKGVDRIGILRSNDGGATWRMRPIAAASFKHLGQAFLSARTTFIVGREFDKRRRTWRTRLLRTSNDGASWKRTRIRCKFPFDFAAPDARHLWFLDSDTSKIWTSSNGGANWTVRTLPLSGTSGSAYEINELQAPRRRVAWVNVTRQQQPYNLVMRTTDGGKHWRKAATYPDYTENGLEALSAREVWLSVADSSQCDASSYVSHTVDGGRTWTRTFVGPRSLGVSDVGPDGTLYSFGRGMGRSTDNGRHWTRLIPDGYEYWLGDVTPTDAGDLWAVGWATPFSPGIYGDFDGEAGVVYRCGDGVRWKQQEIDEGAVLTSVDFAGSAGWIAGLEGRVRHTADGGTNWQELTAGTSRDIYDIQALDAESAIAVADDRQLGRYVIMRTADAGASWATHPMDSPRDLLKRVSILGPSHVLVAGTRLLPTGKRGLLLESTDGGVTWSQRLLQSCTRTVRDMTFIDDSRGWILASTGMMEDRKSYTNYGTQLLRTADGGVSWQTVSLGQVSETGLYAVAFGDPSNGWLFGDKVLKTSDGGLTWRDTGAFLPSAALGQMFGGPVLRAAATVGGNLWAVGADQTIISTVGTAEDVNPPLTTDDGDRLWHNTAVTTRLYASDPGGSGVASTHYRLDGGEWQPITPAGVTVQAPSDHSADGEHRIEYRSTDLAGNTEFVELCSVHIDTRQPVALAGGRVRVRTGKLTRLPFKVTDEQPCGRRGTVTFTILKPNGTVAKRFTRTEQPLNADVVVAYRCRLAPGSYTYEVTARDAAANPQSSSGQGSLTVLR